MRISPELHVRILVHVAYGRGSILLLRKGEACCIRLPYFFCRQYSGSVCKTLQQCIGIAPSCYKATFMLQTFDIIMMIHDDNNNSKWSTNFDERRTAGATFSRREKFNVTPPREVPLWQLLLFLSACLKRWSTNCHAFKWAGQRPSKLPVSLGRSGPNLKHGYLGPPESVP